MAEALQLKKTSKYGILDFWEAQLDNFSGHLNCAQPGIELLVPPYPVHQIRKGKKIHKVASSSVLIFNGYEGHVETFVETSASLKSIVLNTNYISDFCAPVGLKTQDIELSSFEMTKADDLANQVKLLADLSHSSVNASAFSLDCLASEILSGFLIHQEHSQTGKFAKEINSGHFPGTIARIKSVIFKNFDNPQFNLDLLARESGLSKFHLIRVFKKSVGVSPAKFLGQMKIDLAKHWLLKSQKSVVSIAMDLGFSDLSTFNKSFKKALGVTPSEYRARS